MPPAQYTPTPAQYTAVGVSGANLAIVLQWLSVWPLQPPDEAQCASIAGLMLAAGGLIHSIIQSYSK